jgi:hypothetical protein
MKMRGMIEATVIDWWVRLVGRIIGWKTIRQSLAPTASSYSA